MLLFLTACVTQPPSSDGPAGEQVSETDTADRPDQAKASAGAVDPQPFDHLPPIALQIGPLDGLCQACAAGGPDRAELAEAMLALGVPAVGHDAQNTDYQLVLSTWHSAGEARLSYRVSLFWNGQPLLAIEPTRSPLSVSSPATKVAADVLRRLEARRGFSRELLHERLRASDYAAIEWPAAAQDFVRRSQQVFHNPLFGAHARYTHPALPSARFDVYVYPVDRVDWAAPDVLIKHAQQIRRDMQALAQQGYWQTYRLGVDVEESWLLNGRPTPVLWFAGEFADKRYQPFDTFAYLTVQKDKFIKIRASIARNEAQVVDVQVLARKLLTGVRAPDESQFMQALRRAWAEIKRP